MAEAATEKLPIPKSIFFIIGNEFCERFNFYGMRAILSLYLNRILLYTMSDATVIFHIFMTSNYGFAIFGAIISDNWWGRYHTILWLSLVYVSGSVFLLIGAIPQLNLPVRVFCIAGLVLIALGSGGIKPCVAAFGGDQFKLPEQNDQMHKYFSLFYFAINSGSLLSTFITPLLRGLNCLGELHCYPAAFGVPAVLMIIAVVIFICGRPFYRISPHEKAMLVVMFRAICHAIAKKRKSNEPREHWLDYADDKYDKKVLADIKAFLQLLVLYIPLPIFWALFDQQGSRWTFQASRMDGEVGEWVILPEQIHILNPAMVLMFIPLCNFVIYPALKVIGLKTPLQIMVLGGTLAGVSFLISAFVEFELEKTYPILPMEDNAQLRIFNGEACDYTITTNIDGQENFILKSLDAYTYKDIKVPRGEIELVWSVSSTDTSCPEFTTEQITIREKTAYTILLKSKDTSNKIKYFEDNVDKPKRGLPYARIVANIKDAGSIIWKNSDDGHIEYRPSPYEDKLQEFVRGKHKIFVGDKEVMEIDLHNGGSYTIILYEKPDGSFVAKEHHITEKNSIHILWQIPQYIVVTFGEVMYSITGLAFSYAQAPVTMKSVVQAFWLLTIAGGNFIVSLIAGARLLKQSYEFLLFAVLMFVDMVFFSFMAYRYKSHDPHASVEGK